MRGHLILDTNVLLLLLAAQVDPGLLRTFKRISEFVGADLLLLLDFLACYEGLLTTPHVLTEVSNFVDQAPQYSRMGLGEALATFGREQGEIYEEASILVRQAEFLRLGLADTGLVRASRMATVLTRDGALYGAILAGGGRAVLFDNLRSKDDA